jgi:hypothetical protein
MTEPETDFLDERIAALDDKLSELLAQMEATAIEWASGIVRSGETRPPREEP